MNDLKLSNSFIQTFSTVNGVVTEDALKFAKQTLLFNTLREKFNIVKHKKDYPKNATTDVEFTLDCVVLDLNRYNKLIELEQSFTTAETII